MQRPRRPHCRNVAVSAVCRMIQMRR
jgi:hypothetical protein